MSEAPVIGTRLATHRVLSFCIEMTSTAPSPQPLDGSASVLIVDDDPGVRAMLLEYLGGHRYEVRAAENGTEMRAEIERNLLT